MSQLQTWFARAEPVIDPMIVRVRRRCVECAAPSPHDAGCGGV